MLPHSSRTHGTLGEVWFDICWKSLGKDLLVIWPPQKRALKMPPYWSKLRRNLQGVLWKFFIKFRNFSKDCFPQPQIWLGWNVKKKVEDLKGILVHHDHWPHSVVWWIHHSMEYCWETLALYTKETICRDHWCAPFYLSQRFTIDSRINLSIHREPLALASQNLPVFDVFQTEELISLGGRGDSLLCCPVCFPHLTKLLS